MDVYTNPLYYEIAFSFINPQEQADLFLEFIREYSSIKVTTFLDLGCGPTLQLRELSRRGYNTIGLDIQAEMLNYVQEKSEKEGISIECIEADFCDFTLEKKVDFAFIMMGTIGYIKSNQQVLNHLDSVARCLKSGGLYLIEDFRLDWASEDFPGSQSWEMERNHITVKTTYDIQLKDALTQMLTQTLRLEVCDHGTERVYEEQVDVKMIFPQEFLTLVEMNGLFEFLGWFERNSTKKLQKASMDNIVLLRRK